MRIGKRVAMGLFGVGCILGAAIAPAGGAEAPAADNGAAVSAKPAGTDNGAPGTAAGAPVLEKVVLQGVEVELTVAPREGSGELREAEYATVSFRVTDPRTGKPVISLHPGAWMDIRDPGGATCRQKIQQFMQKILTYRPMADLNSYYILLLNLEPTISVIDPNWGLAGTTNLYTTVTLSSPGEDWVKSRDQRRIYVSLPKAGKVAVVDADNFHVLRDVETGSYPVRVALQPDGKYLWVGRDGGKEADGGVTVIDTGNLEVLARIPTGAGHHEIAFADDDRFAFVTNLEAGTLSVIDIRTLKKVKDVATGARPAAVAYSRLGKAAYVADGGKGGVTVVDAESMEIKARIPTPEGLNFLRFSPDQRFGFATSGKADEVYVIDPAANRVAHTVPVPGKPYQVSFTETIAYVRSLGTEVVTMIPLTGLDQAAKVNPMRFSAGNVAPEKASYIGIADVVSPSSQESAVLVANPAENYVYFYQEGMVAPMGGWKNYGFVLKAVLTVDHSLKEGSPGVYSTSVRLPQSGTFDLALLLDSPPASHCFTVAVKENPRVKKVREAYAIEFLKAPETVAAGEASEFRFRLTEPSTKRPLEGVRDLIVRVRGIVGNYGEIVSPKHVGEGVYTASLPTPYPGLYYVYFQSTSLRMTADKAPVLTLRAVARPPGGGVPSTGGSGQAK